MTFMSHLARFTKNNDTKFGEPESTIRLKPQYRNEQYGHSYVALRIYYHYGSQSIAFSGK